MATRMDGSGGAKRRGMRLAGTALGIGGAAAALVIGTAVLKERAGADAALAPAPPTAVEVIRADRVAWIETEARYVGRIEAARAAALAFEQPGTVVEILADEGDRVRAGEVVARLDAERLEARLAELIAGRAALAADEELAALTLSRQRELLARGHAATARLDEARLTRRRLAASIRQADAAIDAARIDIAKAVLRAPFTGVITARRLDEGAIAAAGAPVVELIEASRPQLRVGLPEAVAAGLAPGTRLAVDLGGARADAVVVAVRADTDAATRTRAVILDIAPYPGAAIAFGDSAELILTQRRVADGFWLPVGALREGGRGLWTVMTAAGGEAGEVARPEAVEVLRIDRGRAFVRGTLVDGALVIAGGAHRVAPGSAIASAPRAGPAAPAAALAALAPAR